jgi:maleamate amidohydrolase
MANETTDLNANYAGAFDGHLPFGTRPALIIIDFVMAYLEKSSPLYAGVEDALASNERLLAAARAADIPVIFTNVIYTPGGADGGIFYRKIPALKIFERGSPLACSRARASW